MRQLIILNTYILMLMALIPHTLSAGSSNEELLSKNVAERKDAMTALKNEKDLSRLEQLMTSKEFALRKAATYALRAFDSKTNLEQNQSAKNILIKSLNDESDIIRFEVAQTLATWNDHSGNEELIKNLEHTNPLRRLQAAKALFVTADKRAIPHLIANLKDRQYNIRYSSIQALRKITGAYYGYNPIEPANIVLTEIQQKGLRQTRTELFGEGNVTVNPELLSKANAAYNKACEDVMQGHIKKYSTIRDKAIADWRKWWVDNSEGIRLNWLKLGLDHVNPDTRKMAIESIQFINAVEAHDEVVAKLNDDDHNVVVSACKALAQFKQKKSIPLLIDLMEKTNATDSTDKTSNIKNFAAYTTLKTITQADFGTLFNRWKKWWQYSSDFFKVGVDLPAKDVFNIRAISTSGDTATFEIKYFYHIDNTWIEKECEVKQGEVIGIRNQKHVFKDKDGLSIERFFDFRTGLTLNAVNGNSVSLITPDQKFNHEGTEHVIKGNVFRIHVDE